MDEQEGVEIIDPNMEGVVLPSVDEDTEEDIETPEEEIENNSSEEAEEGQAQTKTHSEDDFMKLKNALNAERKNAKALKKQLNELQNPKKSKSTYDTLVEKGVEKELAKTLSEAIDKPDDRIADLQFDKDVLRASRKEGFEDIEDYTEDIRPLVDKGLTVEQAYYAVTGGIKKKEVNTKSEIRRELEAKMKNNKEKADILDIDTKGQEATPVKNKLKYTSLELAAAKAAGMTIEEYKTIQNMSSTSDYEKYLASKKKK